MGEYLRALVTADAELVHDDKWGYREALMRSFRRRQIFPDHVEFMTEDAVRWQHPADAAADSRAGLRRSPVLDRPRTSRRRRAS